MKISFVDELPASIRHNRKDDPALTELARQLRANPGQWAIYPKKITTATAHATGTRINQGGGKGLLNSGGFQATVRNKVLYVRFIGNEAGE